MSSTKSREKDRPSWFQDTKSGCEKQADYFYKIRKLQRELINREQHNLVNAMERLKQLQYPRRKPVVRNFSLPVNASSSSAFPTRPYAKRVQGNSKYPGTTKIRSLKGKNALPDKNEDVGNEQEAEIASITLDDIRQIYNRMAPKLNEQQIAKIATDVRSTFPNEPSTYLLQPHLPSIPNVKRKNTTRLMNRLKLLTLSEESEYRMAVSVPTLSASPKLYKKQDSCSSSPLPDISEEKTLCHSNKPKNLLHFDVDPNDSSLFVHSTGDNAVIGVYNDIKGSKDTLTSPSPPPNSRPVSRIGNNAFEIADGTSVAEDTNDKENISEVPKTPEQVDLNTKLHGSTKNLTQQMVCVVNEESLSVSEKDKKTVQTDITIAEPKVIITTNKIEDGIN